MSYAILELRLMEPPASVERPSGGWAARCERCGGRSRPYLILSQALRAQATHAQKHLNEDQLDLADAFLIDIRAVA